MKKKKFAEVFTPIFDIPVALIPLDARAEHHPPRQLELVPQPRIK